MRHDVETCSISNREAGMFGLAVMAFSSAVGFGLGELLSMVLF